MIDLLQHPIFLKYLLGVLGSFAVELAAVLRAVAANGGKIPSPYSSSNYVVVRIGFAFIGAGPLASFADSLPIAFYVGVSAPLIFDRLASGVQPFDASLTGKLDSTAGPGPKPPPAEG